MLTPLLDQYPGLFHRAENLAIEQLISELAVEAFIVSILPWASWFDEEGLHTDPLKPFALKATAINSGPLSDRM